MEIDRVGPAGTCESPYGPSCWDAGLYQFLGGGHADEVDRVDELPEDAVLLAERDTPTSRLVDRVLIRPVFLLRGERVVEVIEEGASREYELPCLHSIGGVCLSVEAGFVAADGSIEVSVHCHACRRPG